MNEPPPKPRWLKPDLDRIPDELRCRDQWVITTPTLNGDGKWTKPPLQINGKLASTTDGATWSDFEAVRQTVKRHSDCMPGFVFTQGDPYVGIDLDHCRDPQSGKVTDWAVEVVRALNSYTEISPSGTGIHIIVRGASPPNCRHKVPLPKYSQDAAIEVYDQGRYFALTGCAYKGYENVAERQPHLDALLAQYFSPPRQEERKNPEANGSAGNAVGDASGGPSDEQVLEQARRATNGARFTALYDRGDVSQHGSDDSAADLALCSMLAFFTGPDEAQIDRLFRTSALMRPKWDTRRGEKNTYGAMTIAKALEGKTEFFEWTRGHAFRRPSGEEPEPKGTAAPLHREIPRGDPYPVAALGQKGADAARKIKEARAPLSICAQSTLATMNLAVMGHVDVELPTGDIKPTSEFFATIAGSGERKTSADTRATAQVKELEEDQGDIYRDALHNWTNEVEAWEKCRSVVLHDTKLKTPRDKAQVLKELGPKPEAPISPMMLAGGDPTVEGLIRLFREGGVPIAGMFTDEGGQFVGGHAMNEDSRLRTAASLSKMWDGEPIKRVRGGDGFYTLKGRRLAAHLLFQPEAAQQMFNDPLLRDQGILTRFLATLPERAAGTRPYVEVDDFRPLSQFRQRVRVLLTRGFPYHDSERPREGLKPAVLKLSPDAKRLWIEFYEYVEGQVGPNRLLDQVVGLANKAPEHATRLAATIACFEGDCDAGNLSISAQRMQAGIDLTRHYLEEALRIRMAAAVSADLEMAEKLLAWLRNGWGKREPSGLVSLPDIYQFSPNHSVHDKETAARIAAILVDHGWLESHAPAKVNCTMRRDVWSIIKE